MTSPSELVAKLPPGVALKRFLSTRRGTVVLAAVAALAALGVLLAFMSNYRSSVESGAADTNVLVADRFIDEGTSGDVIAEAGLFQSTTITEDEAVAGAVTDSSALEGQIVTEPIYRGQQLTAENFASGADPIAGKLTGTQRALSLPVDPAQGNIAQIEAGSRVDILGGFTAEVTGGRTRPVLDVLATDVLVMKVAESESGVGRDEEQPVVLRVSDTESTRIAFAADSGDIWLTVRPPTLAKDSKINPVQFESLLGQAITGLGG